MQRLAELFRHHLTGPRWGVTRDIVSGQPDALPELFRAMEADLRLFVDQIEKRETAVDVRTTAEHVVLLFGRMLPVIDTVVADLYMMEVVDLEDEAADERAQPLGSDVVAELRALIARLLELEAREEAEPHRQIIVMLEASVALAALHLKCVRLLSELVMDRLEARSS